MIEPQATESIDPPNDPNQPSDEQRGIVQAAAVLAIGNIVSRLLGLARETVKADLYGASGLLGAYEIAALVPISLYDLIVGGMVNSALVPVFSDFAPKKSRHELWAVLSTVLSVATVILVLAVALVELFAPQIAWLIGANNFTDPLLTDIAISLMRSAAPAVIFLSIASILTGALYALKRFTVPAFLGAVFNGTIVVVALLNPDQIQSLVWGLLLGSFLQIVVQLPALRDARLRWHFDWQHPAVRRILKLYAPILAGLVVSQLAITFSYNLATRTGDQSLSYMRYATTLYQFPLGLIVTALSIATLPTLSRQAVGKLDAFKQTLSEGVNLVIALILPATAGLLALAVPIVALLFEHGAFTAADTETTSLVLRVYLFGLPFAAVDQMLVFASYARKDTWRPALVGVIATIVYSITAVLLLKPLGLLSLMVADAVKHIVHTVIMVIILRHQVGSLAGYGTTTTLAKSLFAAVLTGVTAYFAARWVTAVANSSGFIGQLIPVIVGGVAGLCVYLAMVYLLDIKETKSLRSIFSRRK